MAKRTAIAAVAAASLLTSTMYAQEAKEAPKFGWKKSLVGAINLTQNRYSSNWSQGGENSVAWKGIVEAKWENEQKKINWRNNGKLIYGQVKQGDEDLRKSDDEIKVESVLTYKAGKYLNPYFAFNGETQLTRGYLYSEVNGVTVKEPVSDFFSPAFLRQSLGFGYKPRDNFVTRLGVSIKETIVTQDTISFDNQKFPIRTRYGNAPDEAVRVETGIESTTDFSQKLAENILFTTKLELFSSFENPDAVDMTWDNTLAAKVSKYLSVNLYVRLFYDKDILDEVQVKQVLGFGVTYTFF